MTISKSFADYKDYMADLKAQTAQVDNPAEGDLIIGDPFALTKYDWGWYIVACCMVYKHGKWIQQAYDKVFLEKEDAIEYWESDGEGWE